MLEPIDHGAEARGAASALPQFRFDATLERDYRAFAFESFRGTRGTAYWILLGVLLAFGAVDGYYGAHVFLPNISPAIFATRLSAIAIVGLALWRLSTTSEWRMGYRWIATTLLTIGVMTVICEALYYSALKQFGMPLIMDGNILVMMAIFFPLGYSFLNSLLIAACFSVSAWLILPQFIPPALMSDFYQLLPYQITGLVTAALAGYHQERTMRALFLMKQSVTLMASTDALTGLSNRHAFEPFVQRALLQSAREKQEVALVLVDVDLFKKYNDRYGHPAGDAALKAVARAVSLRIRRQFDLGSRLGGEEFALFFFDANIGFAWSVAEELRRDVEKRIAIAHPDSPSGVLTISLGVAVSQPNEGFEGLYQRADKALYLAKEHGRNQVQLAD